METGWNRSASSKSIFRSPNFFLLDRLWWRRTGSQFAVGRWSRVSCPFPTKSFVPGYGTVSRFPLPTSNNRRPLPLKSRLEKYLIQKRDATWRGILISKYKFLEIIVIYQSRGELHELFDSCKLTFLILSQVIQIQIQIFNRKFYISFSSFHFYLSILFSFFIKYWISLYKLKIKK